MLTSELQKERHSQTKDFVLKGANRKEHETLDKEPLTYDPSNKISLQILSIRACSQDAEASKLQRGKGQKQALVSVI